MTGSLRTTLYSFDAKVLNALRNGSNPVDFNNVALIPREHSFGLLVSEPEWRRGWMKRNWGCEYNAYNVERRDFAVSFETGDRHPYELVHRLSKMFPDEVVMVAVHNSADRQLIDSYMILDGEITIQGDKER